MNDIPKFSSRKFDLILYLTVEETKAICESESNIEEYAFILHDKDKNQDGTQKEPHIHLVLKTKYPYQSTTIYNKFKKDERNVRIIDCKDLQGRLQYLIHKHDKDKYQYIISDVKSNSPQFISLIQKDDWDVEYDKTSQCVMDMANGMSYFELLKTYGHNFVVNFNSIATIANELKYDVLLESIREDDVFV